jgi:hypothetical protein
MDVVSDGQTTIRIHAFPPNYVFFALRSSISGFHLTLDLLFPQSALLLKHPLRKSRDISTAFS